MRFSVLAKDNNEINPSATQEQQVLEKLMETASIPPHEAPPVSQQLEVDADEQSLTYWNYIRAGKIGFFLFPLFLVLSSATSNVIFRFVNNFIQWNWLAFIEGVLGSLVNAAGLWGTASYSYTKNKGVYEGDGKSEGNIQLFTKLLDYKSLDVEAEAGSRYIKINKVLPTIIFVLNLLYVCLYLVALLLEDKKYSKLEALKLTFYALAYGISCMETALIAGIHEVTASNLRNIQLVAAAELEKYQQQETKNYIKEQIMQAKAESQVKISEKEQQNKELENTIDYLDKLLKQVKDFLVDENSIAVQFTESEFTDRPIALRLAIKNQVKIIEMINQRSLKLPDAFTTLGDGNCAFNACALGLCELVENKLLPEQAIATQELLQKLQEKLNLPSSTMKAFSRWLKQHDDNQERQRTIAPILRDFTVSFITHHYNEFDFSSRYKEALRHAYNLYLFDRVNNDDDTFIVHPYIAEKFKETDLTDKDLADWWNTKGYTQYFTTMCQPAEHALDKKRWGSEIELNALAFSLSINIIYQKDNNTLQYLGVGSGWLSDLSQQEIEQLRNLEIGEPFLGGFRLYPGLTEAELIKRVNPLPKSITSLILKLVDNASKNGHRDFPLTITGIDDIFELCCQLEKRHIIQKQGENYLFVGENSQVDVVAIQARMKDISIELRQKLTQGCEGQVPTFLVIHGITHWSYQAAINSNYEYDKNDNYNSNRLFTKSLQNKKDLNKLTTNNEDEAEMDVKLGKSLLK